MTADRAAEPTFGIRLTEKERALVDEAAQLAREPGDRGGTSSWARRVLLREAKRVVGDGGGKPLGTEEK